MDGKLILRKGTEKEVINNDLLKEKRILNILYFFVAILPFIITYFIFDSCINKSALNLANTISLGAIFATFGSAIVSSVILFQSDKSNRILSNVDILYSDILQEQKWTRWPFIKRYDAHKLLDGDITSNVLENPYIIFNVGSHNINISIPTTQEDFYDLPSFFIFKEMKKYNNHFKTNIMKHPDSISDTHFSDVGDYYWAWNCLYDIWKNVILFKISKIIVTLGFTIILSSFIYSFAFIQINTFINMILIGQ